MQGSGHRRLSKPSSNLYQGFLLTADRNVCRDVLWFWLIAVCLYQFKFPLHVCFCFFLFFKRVYSSSFKTPLFVLFILHSTALALLWESWMKMDGQKISLRKSLLIHNDSVSYSFIYLCPVLLSLACVINVASPKDNPTDPVLQILWVSLERHPADYGALQPQANLLLYITWREMRTLRKVL